MKAMSGHTQSKEVKEQEQTGPKHLQEWRSATAVCCDCGNWYTVPGMPWHGQAPKVTWCRYRHWGSCCRPPGIDQPDMPCRQLY